MMPPIDVLGFLLILALALVVGLMGGMLVSRWCDRRDIRPIRPISHIRALENSRPAPDGRGHHVKVEIV